MTFSKSLYAALLKPSLYLSLGVLVIFTLWHYVFDYRVSSSYRCKANETIEFSHPYWPVFADFIFLDTLEVYIGGIVDRGELSISGTGIDGKLTYEGARLGTTIAHYYYRSSWYEPTFSLTFQPTENASCSVKVIYRFRGIY